MIFLLTFSSTFSFHILRKAYPLLDQALLAVHEQLIDTAFHIRVISSLHVSPSNKINIPAHCIN